MLGLTPDPLSAGVGMHVAVAGPYTATNGSPRGRTVQTRNGRIPPGGPFRLAEHARRTAPSPACRKRPFTTHADPAPRAGQWRLRETNHRGGGAVERADAGAVSAGQGRPMKRSIAYDSDAGGRRTHWVDCCGSLDSSPRLLMGFLMRYSFRLLTMTWLVAAGPLQAQDLTVFGGFQHPGTLTLRSGVGG